MVKPFKLLTLNSQLECTMNGVGASENPKKLKQEGKHTGRTNIHETQLGATQVFNYRTPICINVSLSSRMLPNISIARRQTLFLTSISIRVQAHTRPHTCKSENQNEGNDRDQRVGDKGIDVLPTQTSNIQSRRERQSCSTQSSKTQIYQHVHTR